MRIKSIRVPTFTTIGITIDEILPAFTLAGFEGEKRKDRQTRRIYYVYTYIKSIT